MELKDKTAIVTRSGRGIGVGIALVLAREGASVVVNARKAKDLPEEQWDRVLGVNLKDC